MKKPIIKRVIDPFYLFGISSLSNRFIETVTSRHIQSSDFYSTANLYICFFQHFISSVEKFLYQK